jgi:hypothetical protein
LAQLADVIYGCCSHPLFRGDRRELDGPSRHRPEGRNGCDEATGPSPRPPLAGEGLTRLALIMVHPRRCERPTYRLPHGHCGPSLAPAEARFGISC